MIVIRIIITTQKWPSSRSDQGLSANLSATERRAEAPCAFVELADILRMLGAVHRAYLTLSICLSLLSHLLCCLLSHTCSCPPRSPFRALSSSGTFPQYAYFLHAVRGDKNMAHAHYERAVQCGNDADILGALHEPRPRPHPSTSCHQAPDPEP